MRHSQSVCHSFACMRLAIAIQFAFNSLAVIMQYFFKLKWPQISSLLFSSRRSRQVDFMTLLRSEDTRALNAMPSNRRIYFYWRAYYSILILFPARSDVRMHSHIEMERISRCVQHSHHFILMLYDRAVRSQSQMEE